jgi:hypothetical protein
VDDAGRVHHVGVGAHLVQQPRRGVGSGDITDDDVDAALGGSIVLIDEPAEIVGLGGAVREQTQVRALRVGEQPMRERATQPTGGTGDDSGARRRPRRDDGCSDDGCGLRVRHDDLRRRQWRALRMAKAMTDACGLTPGAVGSSEASLT